MTPSKPMDRQFGLSLIELMVAMLLSSLLVLGITQIFIDNKRNYAFQQGQSDNIENARYATLLLEQELYRAGYQTRQDNLVGDTFPASSAGHCSFGQGEIINYDTDDQRICLRYEPHLPEITLCNGDTASGAANPYEESAPVVIELQVFSGTLFCNGTALIENTEDVRFSFGVDAANGGGETRKYTITPASNDAIHSVRYAVLLKSRAQHVTDNTNNPVYRAWHEKWESEANVAAPDRALYFTLENTVAIRNKHRE